jgi:hypothetical protein
MSHDRQIRTTTDLYPPAQAGLGADARVQLKQAVAGLPYNEQVQRLRPPLPMGAAAALQMKADGSAPVQMSGGGAAPPAQQASAPAPVPTTLSGATVKVDAAGQVSISGASISLTAGTIDLNAGRVRSTGVVEAPTVVAQSVVGSSYTPGAGNVF